MVQSHRNPKKKIGRILGRRRVKVYLKSELIFKDSSSPQLLEPGWEIYFYLWGGWDENHFASIE